MCADYKVPFLGGLPLDIRIREQTDSGRPTVVADPDGPDRADLSRDRAQDRGVRRAEGGGFLGEVPEHRRPEYVARRITGCAAISRSSRTSPIVDANEERWIKSDKWIRRMAQEHRMIEPFEPGQVREADGHKIVSYGTSSYGYDIRCSREFKIFTNINSTIVDPEGVRRRVVRRFHRRRLHHPAELVRAGAHRRVLPHSAQRADDLPRKIDVRALRHHRQRDAVRARMGGLRDARVLEHDAAAREDLRQRRRRAGDLLRVRRGLRDVVQGSRRQVPGQQGVTLPKI